MCLLLQVMHEPVEWVDNTREEHNGRVRFSTLLSKILKPQFRFAKVADYDGFVGVNLNHIWKLNTPFNLFQKFV